MDQRVRSALGRLALAALIALGTFVVLGISAANEDALVGSPIRDLVSILCGLGLIAAVVLTAVSLWQIYRALSSSSPGDAA